MRRPRPRIEEDPAALPEARAWADITGLSPAEAVDLVSDVISGRRPVADLPDWELARQGDEYALERIVRAFEMRKLLHRMQIDS